MVKTILELEKMTLSERFKYLYESISDLLVPGILKHLGPVYDHFSYLVPLLISVQKGLLFISLKNQKEAEKLSKYLLSAGYKIKVESNIENPMLTININTNEAKFHDTKKFRLVATKSKDFLTMFNTPAHLDDFSKQIIYKKYMKKRIKEINGVLISANQLSNWSK